MGTGLAGMGEVFVESGLLGGRIEREFPAGVEVKRFRRRIRRRPGVIPAPLVGAGLKYVSFREIERAGIFQIVFEEWKFDMLAEECAGLGAEVHRPQMIAIACPAAVMPWAHYQYVVRQPRALLF